MLALLAWAVSARKWFKGPVRNVDVGHKTDALAEAAMRGELDEADSAFGNEAGLGKGEEIKGTSTPPESDAPKQFVTGS